MEGSMASTSVDGEALQGCAVMVVEDNYYQAEDARDALERAGASVIGPFSEAFAAVAAAERQAPDCALLDLNLGDGADFAAARTLMARGVPVILFTGYDSVITPGDLTTVRWLQKPATPEGIVAAVRSARRR
jgi:DNA-binding response OmpR family regulator